MIADMECNKKLSTIVTELFLWGKALNILLGFISQSYFKVPKTVSLNATHYLSWKFLAKENFNKQHKIICLTLVLKNSLKTL